MSDKKILDMYQVKITQKDNPDNVLFGIVDRFHEQAKELWKENKIVVTEPVYGDQYEVDLNEFDVEEQPLTWGELDPETRMPIETEYDRYVCKEYKEHLARSDKAGEGVKKHRLFRIGVADGFAWYVVTSAGKKNVKIEWRGFCADNYFDPTLRGGGTFPIHCVEHHIRFMDGMKKIFGH
jgi:hypothetical protein